RDRRTRAPLPRRRPPALEAQLPDRARNPRPPHAAARRPAPAGAPAPPLPARRAPDRADTVGLAPRRLPLPPPRDARGAGRLRRGLPPLRRGDRPRLPRRAGRLGALVRPAGRRDPPPPGGHGPPLPHAPDALALAQHRPLRLQAPG